MKIANLYYLVLTSLIFSSCSSFKATRSIANESLETLNCINAVTQIASSHILPEGILNNKVAQLRRWEQISNTKRWEKPTEQIDIEYIELDLDQVNIRDIGASEELKKLLFVKDENKIRWYRHPLNTASSVPYRAHNANGSVKAEFSASRSIFIDTTNESYTFKLPTDRPHPSAAAQPGKADLKNDSILSIRRSEFVNEIDKKIGAHPSLKVLTEVISVSDKRTGNGFSIRDLRPLQDGNYYMPGFSIPYAGRMIAEFIGEDFEVLWGRIYAKGLGEAKAELLLRYGLQMKTPNAQNWLIQLDQNLKPTGKIIIRDLADSNHVEFVAQNIGAMKEVAKDKADDFTIMTELKPYYQNSVWQMDEGGVSPDQIIHWGEIHNEAYINTFKKALRIQDNLGIDSIEKLQLFLESSEGQLRLKEYAKREGLVWYKFKNLNNFISFS